MMWLEFEKEKNELEEEEQIPNDLMPPLNTLINRN